MSISDVREFVREAERLEGEATDCRIQAAGIVRAEGLCPVPDWYRCCGDPDACTAPVPRCGSCNRDLRTGLCPNC